MENTPWRTTYPKYKEHVGKNTSSKTTHMQTPIKQCFVYCADIYVWFCARGSLVGPVLYAKSNVTLGPNMGPSFYQNRVPQGLFPASVSGTLDCNCSARPNRETQNAQARPWFFLVFAPRWRTQFWNHFMDQNEGSADPFLGPLFGPKNRAICS